MLGTAGAYLIARVMTEVLYGVSPFDPIAYAASALALGVIATLAAAGPARRALTINPAVLLRAE